MTRVLFALLVLVASAPAQAAIVNISEVLYDADGSDSGRVFVELWGPAGFDLRGLRLEGVNGSGGGIGPVIELAGAIPADGFFVLADAPGGVTEVPDADQLASFDFQNGPDSLRLVGAGDVVLDALGYGVFGGGDVFGGEGTPASDPPAGQSVARVFANVDTDVNAVDFAPLATPTPGAGPLEVPEPSAAGLLAAGWIALALVRRRALG